MRVGSRAADERDDLVALRACLPHTVVGALAGALVALVRRRMAVLYNFPE